MKTDALIDMLAANAGLAPRAAVARRLGPVVVLGVVASAIGAVLSYGLIPAWMWSDASLWIKLGYALALAASGVALVNRLARPGAVATSAWRVALAVLVLMVALGVATLMQAPPERRMTDWMGHSWASCPWHVLLLSLPALGLAMWALRGLAPTRARAAGAAAGLLAGALGAAGYSLACTELAPAFVATWYTLGIAGAMALGALLGPRLLRW